VKHNHFKKLVELASNTGISIDTFQIDQLNSYYQLLLRWGKKINLFSSGDRQYLVERHFAASFMYVKQLLNDNYDNKKKYMDFGSGAGFPGIIISILLKPENLLLLDSNRKKTLFLKEVIKKHELSCAVLCSRIEEIDNRLRILHCSSLF